MDPRRNDQADLAEVRQALEMTTERMTVQGRPWCPVKTGAFLTREMLCLGPSLPGLAQRAVRLARVLEWLRQREGYVGALYRLPTLTTAAFSDQLQRNLARLDGVAEVDGETLYLTEEAMGVSGTVTHSAAQASAIEQGGASTAQIAGSAEPEDASRRLGPIANVVPLQNASSKAGRPPRSAGQLNHFTFRLSSLPIVAAYLDVVHNMLGYAAVAALLGPVTRPPAGQCDPETVRIVSRDLSRAVDGWLRARLDSQHAMRQGAEISKFLHLRNASQVSDGMIDNAAILAFWQSYAPLPDPPVDGFIQFRSVARLMLGFRRAQRLAALEVEHPGYAGAEGVGAPDPFELAEESLSFDTFHSPLLNLAVEPPRRVKWMTSTRQDLLLLWLDTPGGEDGETTLSLFAGDPPSEEFALTAVRAAVFGSQQSLLIRNGSAAEAKRPDSDVVRLPGRPMDYQALSESFARLAAEGAETAACAAHHLLERRRTEVVPLAEALWPEAVIRAIETVSARAADLLRRAEGQTDGPGLRDVVAIGLQSGSAAEPLSRLEAMAERLGLSSSLRAALLAEVVAELSQALDSDARRQMAGAKRNVRRAGMTDASLTDLDTLAGLAAGAAEFARLLGWIRKLDSAIRRVDTLERFDGDRQIFYPVFAQMYPDAMARFGAATQYTKVAPSSS